MSTTATATAPDIRARLVENSRAANEKAETIATRLSAARRNAREGVPGAAADAAKLQRELTEAGAVAEEAGNALDDFDARQAREQQAQAQAAQTKATQEHRARLRAAYLANARALRDHYKAAAENRLELVRLAGEIRKATGCGEVMSYPAIEIRARNSLLPYFTHPRAPGSEVYLGGTASPLLFLIDPRTLHNRSQYTDWDFFELERKTLDDLGLRDPERLEAV